MPGAWPEVSIGHTLTVQGNQADVSQGTFNLLDLLHCSQLGQNSEPKYRNFLRPTGPRHTRHRQRA